MIHQSYGDESCSANQSESIEEDDEFEDDDRSNPPQQRNAANARERARMRVLSKAFCRLKTTLPWVPSDTKLSKLDTLRLATSYIAHLRAILRLSNDDQTSTKNSSHPINLSWPFNNNFHPQNENHGDGSMNLANKINCKYDEQLVQNKSYSQYTYGLECSKQLFQQCYQTGSNIRNYVSDVNFDANSKYCREDTNHRRMQFTQAFNEPFNSTYKMYKYTN